MAHAPQFVVNAWTAADLVEWFGAIPLWRLRDDPPPGAAKEEDVVRIHDHEDRLYELVWYIYPTAREIRVYESPDHCTTLACGETLDGRQVLPGFTMSLADFFAEPGQSPKS